MVGIRYGLQIHKDAEADINRIRGADSDAGAQIVAFLEELSKDQLLLDSLTVQGYEDARVTVSMVVKLQRQRWNGWRLTLRDLEPPEDKLPYRILYAFDGKRRIYHVIGVKERRIAYDDATIDRACEICRTLGLDPLPGG